MMSERDIQQGNLIMKPIIDHIQITVKDLDNTEFYDKFFPILGFLIA